MSDPRSRLDVTLVRRGLARSRAAARAAIEASAVSVDGHPVTKASATVEGTAQIVLTAEPQRWVGRAAYKLVGALQAWTPSGLLVARRRCLDIGACTGGFTQVLLAGGAATVLALDVGRGQLADEVRSDPRVTERSETNIREIGPGSLGPPFDLVVADVSFISLEHVLPRVTDLLGTEGDAVLLVKPQFEVGRGRLGKGGVVRPPEERARALRAVIGYAETARLGVMDVMASPIDGSTGNQEYLLWVAPRRSGTLRGPVLIDRVDAVVGLIPQRGRP